ncbi:MAG: hypothetical protein HQ515_09495 [Phycisphaeraceae bacterium]|nr:hypothetical protein [Phycisphaeraceae bacterium]
MPKRKPDQVYKSGPCSLAIWIEQKDDGKGGTFESKLYCLTRSRKVDTNKYDDSSIWFYHSEVGPIDALLTHLKINHLVKQVFAGAGQNG